MIMLLHEKNVFIKKRLFIILDYLNENEYFQKTFSPENI